MNVLCLRRAAVLLLALALIGSACNFNPPVPATPGDVGVNTQDVAFTAVAQTLQVQLTLSAVTQPVLTPTYTATAVVAIDATITPSPLPTATFVPVQVVTATPTLAPPAAPITGTLTVTGTLNVTGTMNVTSTPAAAIASSATPLPTGVAVVNARMNTNCRSGPDSQYKVLGYLIAGQTAEVFGKNRFGGWWLIRNPNNQDGRCWVWSGTAKLQGEAGNIPVTDQQGLILAQTPDESKAFRVASVNITYCGGLSTAIFEIANRSGQPLQSVSLKIEALSGDGGALEVLSGPASSNTPFLAHSKDCSAGSDRLNAGASGFLAASIPDPALLSGNTVRTTTRLCTQDGLEGTCYERSVEWVIP